MCVCIVAVVVAYLGNAVGKKVEVAISQVERMPNILQAAAVLSCPFLLLFSMLVSCFSPVCYSRLCIRIQDGGY